MLNADTVSLLPRDWSAFRVITRSLMSAPFTQHQLDSFWSQYVGMSAEQVRVATTPGQDGFLGTDWSAMLDHVQRNRLYGFANYLPLPGHTGGENQGIGSNIGIFNGPIKS